jgi:hypothetical protein
MLADLAGLDTLTLLAAEGKPPPEGVTFLKSSSSSGLRARLRRRLGPRRAHRDAETWPEWMNPGEEEFEVWAVGIDPAARVYEVHEPGDWGRLAATYPRDVTASRWHDWSRWTGREGQWILPDWRSVAAQ